ncbi:JUNB [Branchiostoma lanceolatum]|uniref:JUNB protein n=1 Tax=Branchiostoma lanceolatum TaxID=7740 RepID=A0A8J9ZRE1_BRALA|nr:JUNB [Branchiostoma lanceolatum]
MSENSVNEVPELPPPILLAGESDVVHLTTVQQHLQSKSSSADPSQQENVMRDSSEFNTTEMLSSDRRLGSAKPEQIKIDAEDEERFRLRRDKNREAAARCRLKRRDREERLRKHTVCLENANSGLHAEIARLQQELKRLSVHVMNHIELCHAPWRTKHLTAAPETDHAQDSATPPD